MAPRCLASSTKVFNNFRPFYGHFAPFTAHDEPDAFLDSFIQIQIALLPSTPVCSFLAHLAVGLPVIQDVKKATLTLVSVAKSGLSTCDNY